MTKITLVNDRDPSAFRTRQVDLILRGRDVHVYTVGPELDYERMTAGRNPVALEELARSLRGEHRFANIGVTGVFTITFRDASYLVLVDKGRYLGHVAGYVHIKDLTNPKAALIEELEEILPVDSDKKVIRFQEGTNVMDTIPNPFPHAYGTNELLRIVLQQPARYRLGMHTPVHIDDRLLEVQPTWIADPRSNSLQLCFGYHLSQEAADLQARRVTLHHTEETPPRDNGKIHVELHQAGVYLVKLEAGRLTGEIYQLIGGQLRPFDTREVKLSPMFGRKQGAMLVQQKPLSLEEALKAQE